MGAAAFTHHEMLGLSEPFVRAGWRPDMQASDRQQRLLLLRPRSPQAGQPDLHLRLEQAEPGSALTLTRVAALAPGLTATLQARGDDPAELLARIEAVPVQRQWWSAPGQASALTHHVERTAAGAGAGAPALRLREAHAQVAGLALSLRMTGVEGYPADIEIARSGVQSLPEDLLAVLGPGFSPLTELSRGWVGTVRLRGAGDRRSAAAEARWRQLVEHLAITLAEPPRRFHERHLGARWRFALRSTGPWWLGAALLAIALYAQQQGAWGQSVLALMANAAPPLLMALFFMRREMPRLALPRWPRPPAPSAWTPVVASASGITPASTIAPTAIPATTTAVGRP